VEDLQIAQDLIDTLAVQNAVGFPLDLVEFVKHASELQRISVMPAAEPSEIIARLRGIYLAIGPIHMRMMFDTPHDVDDLWVNQWCRQPHGRRLEAADCPVGTVPLWTNGKWSVYVGFCEDDNGHEVFFFNALEVGK